MRLLFLATVLIVCSGTLADSVECIFTRQLGLIDTPGQARDVVADGNRLIVADLNDGIQILDVSDPANATIIGKFQTDRSTISIDVVGDLVYALNERGYIEIVDISEPAAPVSKSRFGSFQSASDIRVENGYAYVAWRLGTAGVKIFDVHDPDNPIEVGLILPGPGNSYGIEVEDGIVFAAGGIGSLLAIDAKDPSNPILLSNTEIPGAPLEIQKIGDILFVADSLAGLLVFDVDDPADPILIGSQELPSFTRGVSVEGDIAAVSTHEHGIFAIDVQDPSNPEIRFRYLAMHEAYKITLDCGIAYVAEDRLGVQVISFEDIPESASLASVSVPGPAVANIAVRDDLIFVTNTDSMRIYDATDLANITLLSVYDDVFGAGEVLIEDQTVYLSDGNGGMHIVDTSDPSNPVLVERWLYGFGQEGWVREIVRRERLTVIAVSNFGFRILDTSDPMNIQPLSEYDSGSRASGIAMDDHHIYLANDGRPIDIVNISNRAEPLLVSEIEVGEYVLDLVLADELLYAATTSGLRIYNVADPINPQFISHTPTASNTWNVEVRGDTIYLAAREAGLYILDASDPFNPEIVGLYRPGTRILDVAVQGNRAFLAESSEGFEVVEVGEECWNCAPDMNGDHVLDGLDITEFITLFLQLNGVADFNCDRQIDIFDVFDYFSAFNAGCP